MKIYRSNALSGSAILISTKLKIDTNKVSAHSEVRFIKVKSRDRISGETRTIAAKSLEQDKEVHLAILEAALA